MKKRNIFKKITILIFLCSLHVSAQNNFFYSTSLQMVAVQGNESIGRNSFFYYNGIRFQTKNFSLSLNLPIVFQSMNDVSDEENYQNSGHMNGIGGMNNLNIGLGDLYLYSSLKLLNESELLPSFFVEGYIKAPTASSHLSIGTGEFDIQLAGAIRKYVQKFSFFAQIGYLFLGNSEYSEAVNPFTFNLGIGYVLNNYNHSFLLVYDSYSTIVQGTSSPQQIGVGYNYKINGNLFVSSIVSKGLNRSSADYSVSFGINKQL